LSSNGGLVVLREAARRLDLAGVIADPLPDTRNPLLVVHSYRTMVTARMMAIAAGYEDTDDLDALRHDPALMIACEPASEHARGIASQPPSRAWRTSQVTAHPATLPKLKESSLHSVAIGELLRLAPSRCCTISFR
jgi:hypothetical protein